MEILVTIMKYAAAIALGYLLGCADAAWLAARLAGKDVKKMGNGNVGASNVAMSMGVFPGVLVATWDIFKAVLAGMAAAYILQAPVLACVLSAAMAVVGHVYPFWLGFDGGKGFAPYVGFVVFMDWRLPSSWPSSPSWQCPRRIGSPTRPSLLDLGRRWPHCGGRGWAPGGSCSWGSP